MYNKNFEILLIIYRLESLNILSQIDEKYFLSDNRYVLSQNINSREYIWYITLGYLWEISRIVTHHWARRLNSLPPSGSVISSQMCDFSIFMYVVLECAGAGGHSVTPLLDARRRLSVCVINVKSCLI